MSKKKIVSLCLVVCLLATAIGGTLAYFTDTDKVTNTMTMGKVKITQNEYERVVDDEGKKTTTLKSFSGAQPLLPMGDAPAWAADTVTVNGDSFKVFSSENVLDKIVTVTNNGNTPAYVRTIVALEAGNSEDEARNLWNKHIAVTDNSDDGVKVKCEDNNLFVKIGETYFIIVTYTYKDAIPAGANSVASLTGVALYSNTEQADVVSFGETYSVLVLSQAVQASDMGTDAGAALDKAFGEVNASNAATWFTAA